MQKEKGTAKHHIIYHENAQHHEQREDPFGDKKVPFLFFIAVQR